MPKVELHVHLEGSTRPETLLKLARKNDVDLPADTLEGLRDWYRFTDFPHFATIYWKCAECLKTAEDVELIAREFLEGQAAQNIWHTEATYTPLTQFRQSGIPFEGQLQAINRARQQAESELGVTMSLTIDIPREACSQDESMAVADWAISGNGCGVTGFGLGGAEVGFPPEMFRPAFDRARAAGLPSVPHAGETDGPSSIWGAIDELGAVRIGHGIRCLEDPNLVDQLRQRRTVLEVCPTSNVCLGVVPDFGSHLGPRLLDEGLLVTFNSDDPPMFNTTLEQELVQAHEIWGLTLDQIADTMQTAIDYSFASPDRKAVLSARLKDWRTEIE